MAISIVVLAAIGMAISLHLRVVENGRQEVEEAQLARALLRLIADDLRASVEYRPPDLEGLTLGLGGGGSGGRSGGGGGGGSASGGNSGGGGGGGGGGGTGGGGGAGGGSGSGVGNAGSLESGAAGGSSFGGGGGSSAGGRSGSGGGTGGSAPSGGGQSVSDLAADIGGAVEDAASMGDIAEATTVPARPGLYGNQYQMQIDVSRLPRVEQYDRWLAADAEGAPADMTSDVKTIAYYVVGADRAATATGTAAAGGLVRRQLDRAATLYADEQGTATQLMQYERLLAPEVAALEFRYFNGTEWLLEWDSTDAGLPLAVEISLALATGAGAVGYASPAPAAELSQAAEMGYRVYRLVVHLPAAGGSNGQDGGSAGSSDESTTTEAAP